MGRDNGEKKGEGISGTTIKDSWTKSRRMESGEGGVDGLGGRGLVGGKMQTTVFE